MSELAQVLRHLVPIDDEHVLVDASTGDDAAVYALGDGRALVVTLDFFTPLVDDPYDFGRIAAANALSGRLRDGCRAAVRPQPFGVSESTSGRRAGGGDHSRRF